MKDIFKLSNRILELEEELAESEEVKAKNIELTKQLSKEKFKTS